jgi:hypothetical protein
MRRKAVTAVVAILALGLFTSSATAQSNGGGTSGDAPGQVRAAANCRTVWSEIQAALVAGGGPKSAVVESIGTTSGPTNCDHFWQGEGIIGNG